MEITGFAFWVLVAKFVFSGLFSIIAIGLAVMGFILVRNENGQANSAISKFKFWGLDLSSPSAGLVIIVVSMAWGLIAYNLLPKLEIEDGHIKISLNDVSKPISETVAILKAPDGKQSPGIGEALLKFEDLAVKRYAATANTTVETDVSLEKQMPVFKLKATSAKKTIEEQYTVSYKNGLIEFTPFSVSAVDSKRPESTLAFDCPSSIEAFFKKVQSEPTRVDILTHKKALKSICPNELSKLPDDKKMIFDSKN